MTIDRIATETEEAACDGYANPVSPLLILVIYGVIFSLLDRYDWDWPFVGSACLASLLWLILAVGVSPGAPARRKLLGRRSSRIELFALILLSAFLTERALILGLAEFGQGPRVDIGTTTQEAARMIFVEGQNPYAKSISVFGDDPDFWGYKYGPMMPVGYFLASLSERFGLQISNFIYLVAALALVSLLASAVPPNAGPSGSGMATRLFCYCSFLLPYRVWYELFFQGVIDIFPASLLLASLYAVERRAWPSAGLLAGLSFSAKFAPAIFFIVLFVRREFKPSFFAGVAAGMLPLVLFSAWDPGALFRNVFLFHVIWGHDSTSLYGITPEELHFVFPLARAATVCAVVATNFGRPITVETLVKYYIILAVIFMVTHTEIHQNHLLWIIPFASLHLGWNRYQLLAPPPPGACLPPQRHQGEVPGQAPAAEPSTARLEQEAAGPGPSVISHGPHPA